MINPVDKAQQLIKESIVLLEHQLSCFWILVFFLIFFMVLGLLFVDIILNSPI